MLSRQNLRHCRDVSIIVLHATGSIRCDTLLQPWLDRSMAYGAFGSRVALLLIACRVLVSVLFVLGFICSVRCFTMLIYS